jgi:TIR domain
LAHIPPPAKQSERAKSSNEICLLVTDGAKECKGKKADQMQFDYNVFISYSREDRPWAERLSQSLQAQGLKAFYDRESIRIGDQWEPALIKAIDASRHLVVLWSSYAQSI